MTASESIPAQPLSTAPIQREDEFALLCALASANLSSQRRERIAACNLSSLDWTRFLALAENHGVLPLAARNLLELQGGQSGHGGAGIPLGVQGSLHSYYQANLRRSLRFAAELQRILRQFERRAVPSIPYKGPALAQSVYGDLGLRSFSDLDLLISGDDFHRANQALAEIGYRPTAELSPPLERLWLRIGYERSFDGAAGKNLVELQWALLPHFYAIDLQPGDLLQRAGRTVIAGCEVLCLSPEDALLALCVHAAKHLWTRLIWLCDIAETLRVGEAPGVSAGHNHPASITAGSGDLGVPAARPIDYTLALSRARELGIARLLGVSFWLAKNVLHRDLPATADALVSNDPQVALLGREFAQRLARAQAYDFESTEYFRLIARLRERQADRWRYLWRLVWTPGAGDIAAARLPQPLFPLYRVVRTARLLRKCCRVR
jgi:hypothetical protein